MINWVAVGVLLAAGGLAYEIRRDRQPKAMLLVFPTSTADEKEVVRDLETKGDVLSWDVRNKFYRIRWQPNNEAARRAVLKNYGMLTVEKS